MKMLQTEMESPGNIHDPNINPHSSSPCTSFIQDSNANRPDFRLELERLKSFKGLWPSSAPISAERLAKAGFYYTGTGDTVKCFFCEAEIHNWQYGDSAAGKHRRLVPNCQFIQGCSVGNVPLNYRHSRSSSSEASNQSALSRSSSADMLPSPPLPEEDVVNTQRVCSSVTRNANIADVQNQGSQDARSSDCDVQYQRYSAFPQPNTFNPYDVQSSTQQRVFDPRCGSSAATLSCTETSPEAHSVVPCDLSFLHGHIRGGCSAQLPASSRSSCESLPSQNLAFQHGSANQSAVPGKDNEFLQGSYVRQTPPGHSVTPGLVSVDLEALKSESERLKTFVKWSVRFIKAEELAKAGFVYTGSGDRVKCVFCQGMLQGWERNDRPLEEHKKHFPHCGFARGLDVGNEAIESTPPTVSSRSEERMPAHSVEENMLTSSSNLEPGWEVINMIGVATNNPRHPEFATLDSRVQTFSSWPANTREQTPKELAEAGFYYLGISDNVKCFFCDGGLRNWEPQDSVWVEHARWFPRCGFLKLVKGEEFIAEIQVKYPRSTQMLSNIARGQAVQTQIGTSENNDQTGNFVFVDTQITEEQVQSYMNSIPVEHVKAMGFSDAIIELAVRRRLEAGETTLYPERIVHTITKLEEICNEQNTESGNEAASKDHLTIPPLILNQKPKDEPLTLEEENRVLKEQRLCKICMDEEVGVAFLPCEHLISCVQCAPALKLCPMCRKPIKTSIRTYLS